VRNRTELKKENKKEKSFVKQVKLISERYLMLEEEILSQENEREMLLEKIGSLEQK